ncbi:MAG: hypothetical protein QNJ13_12300 [Paracoccaceae bacterium]|nr:hypothetical protein [Paracoccaceae bacterium]
MRRILMVLVLAAAPAAAGQPISESLAECAVIYEKSADIFADRGRHDHSETLLTSRDAFRAEAVMVGESEGRDDPVEYVLAVERAKAEKWGHLTLLKLAMNQDFRDWADYCRSLGRHRGLQVPSSRG